MAAEGTPAVQDTVMVTVRWEDLNTTCAVAAGPRTTFLASKPCCGLQDSR